MTDNRRQLTTTDDSRRRSTRRWTTFGRSDARHDDGQSSDVRMLGMTMDDVRTFGRSTLNDGHTTTVDG